MMTVSGCGIGKDETMSVELVPASREDIRDIWEIQVKAFSPLLEKYQDYATSPAAESPEQVLRKHEEAGARYYFINAGGRRVGMVRAVDRGDGSRKRISPICILPEYRGRGYAQAAIHALEELFGASNWGLDTILQEPGNLHLYEKLGYHRTGGTKRINDRMDLVFFEKD